MGTLGITRDIWKGNDAIFKMLQPKEKRRYNTFDSRWRTNREVMMMDPLPQVILDHVDTGGIEVTRHEWDGELYLGDRRPSKRTTVQLPDGIVLIKEYDQYGDLFSEYRK